MLTFEQVNESLQAMVNRYTPRLVEREVPKENAIVRADLVELAREGVTEDCSAREFLVYLLKGYGWEYEDRRKFIDYLEGRTTFSLLSRKSEELPAILTTYCRRSVVRPEYIYYSQPEKRMRTWLA